MGDASDFTFCQVSPNRNDDVLLESPRVVLDVGTVSLEGARRSDTPPPPLKDGANAGDLSTSSSQQEESGENLSGGASVRSQAVPQASAAAARRRPVTRAKVPFEKGFSQMDWLKLTRTHPDLAASLWSIWLHRNNIVFKGGSLFLVFCIPPCTLLAFGVKICLKGKSNGRLISMDEVRQHKTGGSVWTVLKGRVYNISPYMKFHPGGTDLLMKAAGQDCTSLFNKYHAWVNAEFLLEKCLVGVLDDGS